MEILLVFSLALNFAFILVAILAIVGWKQQKKEQINLKNRSN